jgi:predicted MFS family arabinose efflux permease
MAATSLALPLPATVPYMAIAIAAFGLALAPWLAAADELVARVTPAPHTAETYGWLLTAGQLGSASGSALAGPIADHTGTGAPFLIVPAALVAALGVGFRRRRTLRRPAGSSDVIKAPGR